MKKEETMRQTAETYSDTEMELVRIKIVNARARLGASLADIPTGREYDSPPEVSDELVHNALRKTSNATLLVHPTVKTEHVEKENSVVRHENKLGYMYIPIGSLCGSFDWI